VFLKREDIAAHNVRLCFIDEGLCPREIVIFDLAFGKALVQQGPRRLLDGSKSLAATRALRLASRSAVRVITIVYLTTNGLRRDSRKHVSLLHVIYA
jgi:hypothetical protein